MEGAARDALAGRDRSRPGGEGALPARGRQARLDRALRARCRSGSDAAYSFGDVITPRLVNDAGHGAIAHAGSYREMTTSVGQLGVANAFGLYDMHGNVFEWCLDPWHESYEQAPEDGRVWLHGDPSYRVLRGGGWRWVDSYSRSAYRRRFPPGSGANDLGFRVVSGGPVAAATR